MFIIRYLRLVTIFAGLDALQAPQRRRYEPILRFIERLRLAVFFVLLAIAIGITGYMLIENFSFFDAYYMTIITLASVGFGEIHPLSMEGRLFTSFLILFNLGLFTYAISTISAILLEGGFSTIMENFKMSEQINDLTAHTIVCGYGRHAKEVVMELSKQNMPFVLIENNATKIEQLRQLGNFLYIDGDATLDDILQEAGISKASSLVISLPNDADNLFITLSARQLNPKLRIISRAMDARDEQKLLRAGANHVVTPERIGGFYMATLVYKPDLVEFFSLLSNMGPNSVMFEEIDTNMLQPSLIGKTIEQSGIRMNTGVSIVAIRRENGLYDINPSPSHILSPSLHLVLLGNQEQMTQFKAMACR